MAKKSSATELSLCRTKRDEVFKMTSLLHLKTASSTGPIRPSQRQDIPRMHFTGGNMLILAQQPMAVQESCSRYIRGGIRLRGGDMNSVGVILKSGQTTVLRP